ncbi:MAG: hypothetical protein ACYSSL_05635 [Planctomycetota bacterium]
MIKDNEGLKIVTPQIVRDMLSYLILKRKEPRDIVKGELASLKDNVSAFEAMRNAPIQSLVFELIRADYSLLGAGDGLWDATNNDAQQRIFDMLFPSGDLSKPASDIDLFSLYQSLTPLVGTIRARETYYRYVDRADLRALGQYSSVFLFGTDGLEVGPLIGEQINVARQELINRVLSDAGLDPNAKEFNFSDPKVQQAMSLIGEQIPLFEQFARTFMETKKELKHFDSQGRDRFSLTPLFPSIISIQGEEYVDSTQNNDALISDFTKGINNNLNKQQLDLLGQSLDAGLRSQATSGKAERLRYQAQLEIQNNNGLLNQLAIDLMTQAQAYALGSASYEWDSLTPLEKAMRNIEPPSSLSSEEKLWVRMATAEVKMKYMEKVINANGGKIDKQTAFKILGQGIDRLPDTQMPDQSWREPMVEIEGGRSTQARILLDSFARRDQVAAELSQEVGQLSLATKDLRDAEVVLGRVKKSRKQQARVDGQLRTLNGAKESVAFASKPYYISGVKAVEKLATVFSFQERINQVGPLFGSQRTDFINGIPYAFNIRERSEQNNVAAAEVYAQHWDIEAQILRQPKVAGLQEKRDFIVKEGGRLIALAAGEEIELSNTLRNIDSDVIALRVYGDAAEKKYTALSTKADIGSVSYNIQVNQFSLDLIKGFDNRLAATADPSGVARSNIKVQQAYLEDVIWLQEKHLGEAQHNFQLLQKNIDSKWSMPVFRDINALTQAHINVATQANTYLAGAQAVLHEKNNNYFTYQGVPLLNEMPKDIVGTQLNKNLPAQTGVSLQRELIRGAQFLGLSSVLVSGRNLGLSQSTLADADLYLRPLPQKAFAASVAGSQWRELDSLQTAIRGSALGEKWLMPALFPGVYSKKELLGMYDARRSTYVDMLSFINDRSFHYRPDLVVGAYQHLNNRGAFDLSRFSQVTHDYFYARTATEKLVITGALVAATAGIGAAAGASSAGGKAVLGFLRGGLIGSASTATISTMYDTGKAMVTGTPIDYYESAAHAANAALFGYVIGGIANSGLGGRFLESAGKSTNSLFTRIGTSVLGKGASQTARFWTGGMLTSAGSAITLGGGTAGYNLLVGNAWDRNVLRNAGIGAVLPWAVFGLGKFAGTKLGHTMFNPLTTKVNGNLVTLTASGFKNVLISGTAWGATTTTIANLGSYFANNRWLTKEQDAAIFLTTFASVSGLHAFNAWAVPKGIALAEAQAVVRPIALSTLKGGVNLAVVFGNVDMSINNALAGPIYGWRDAFKFGADSFTGMNFSALAQGIAKRDWGKTWEGLKGSGYFAGAKGGFLLGSAIGLIGGTAQYYKGAQTSFSATSTFGKHLKSAGRALKGAYGPSSWYSYLTWPATAVGIRGLIDKEMTVKEVIDTALIAVGARFLAGPNKYAKFLTQRGSKYADMKTLSWENLRRHAILLIGGSGVNIAKDFGIGRYESRTGIPLGDRYFIEVERNIYGSVARDEQGAPRFMESASPNGLWPGDPYLKREILASAIRGWAGAEVVAFGAGRLGNFASNAQNYGTLTPTESTIRKGFWTGYKELAFTGSGAMVYDAATAAVRWAYVSPMFTTFSGMYKSLGLWVQTGRLPKGGILQVQTANGLVPLFSRLGMHQLQRSIVQGPKSGARIGLALRLLRLPADKAEIIIIKNPTLAKAWNAYAALGQKLNIFGVVAPVAREIIGMGKVAALVMGVETGLEFANSILKDVERGEVYLARSFDGDLIEVPVSDKKIAEMGETGDNIITLRDGATVTLLQDLSSYTQPQREHLATGTSKIENTFTAWSALFMRRPIRFQLYDEAMAWKQQRLAQDTYDKGIKDQQRHKEAVGKRKSGAEYEISAKQNFKLAQQYAEEAAIYVNNIARDYPALLSPNLAGSVFLYLGLSQSANGDNGLFRGADGNAINTGKAEVSFSQAYSYFRKAGNTDGRAAAVNARLLARADRITQEINSPDSLLTDGNAATRHQVAQDSYSRAGRVAYDRGVYTYKQAVEAQTQGLKQRSQGLYERARSHFEQAVHVYRYVAGKDVPGRLSLLSEASRYLGAINVATGSVSQGIKFDRQAEAYAKAHAKSGDTHTINRQGGNIVKFRAGRPTPAEVRIAGLNALGKALDYSEKGQFSNAEYYYKVAQKNLGSEYQTQLDAMSGGTGPGPANTGLLTAYKHATVNDYIGTMLRERAAGKTQASPDEVLGGTEIYWITGLKANTGVAGHSSRTRNRIYLNRESGRQYIGHERSHYFTWERAFREAGVGDSAAARKAYMNSHPEWVARVAAGDNQAHHGGIQSTATLDPSASSRFTTGRFSGNSGQLLNGDGASANVRPGSPLYQTLLRDAMRSDVPLPKPSRAAPKHTPQPLPAHVPYAPMPSYRPGIIMPPDKSTETFAPLPFNAQNDREKRLAIIAQGVQASLGRDYVSVTGPAPLMTNNNAQPQVAQPRRYTLTPVDSAGSVRPPQPVVSANADFAVKAHGLSVAQTPSLQPRAQAQPRVYTPPTALPTGQAQSTVSRPATAPIIQAQPRVSTPAPVTAPSVVVAPRVQSLAQRGTSTQPQSSQSYTPALPPAQTAQTASAPAVGRSVPAYTSTVPNNQVAPHWQANVQISGNPISGPGKMTIPAGDPSIVRVRNTGTMANVGNSFVDPSIVAVNNQGKITSTGNSRIIDSNVRVNVAAGGELIIRGDADITNRNVAINVRPGERIVIDNKRQVLTQAVSAETQTTGIISTPKVKQTALAQSEPVAMPQEPKLPVAMPQEPKLAQAPATLTQAPVKLAQSQPQAEPIPAPAVDNSIGTQPKAETQTTGIISTPKVKQTAKSNRLPR